MKKWAKILMVIGIIWVILILAFNITLYIKVKQLSPYEFQDVESMGKWQGIIETVDLQTPFTDVLVYFLEMGIPAWIIFIIVGIWGREKSKN